MTPQQVARVLLRSLPAAVVVADSDSRITDASRTFEELLGYPAGGLLGIQLDRLFRNETCMARVQALLAGAEHHSVVDERLIGRSHEEVAVRLELLRLPDPTGTVAIALLVVEGGGGGRKDLELGQQLHRVLDRISDGFVTFDRDWRITYLNRVAEDHFRLHREDVLGRVLWDVYPVVRGTALERELLSAASGQRPTEFELKSPISGKWLSYRFFPSATGLTGYFHDLTGRREAEAARRSSEASFRAMFENALDGILLTRPDGTITDANPAACRMLGRTVTQIAQLGRDGVVDPTDPRVPALLEERRRTGHARGEVTFVRGDGSKFTGEVSSGLFRDGEDQERTSMIFFDVTERHRAEASLRVLAEATVILASSLDFETTLQNVVSLVASRLAHLCFVDLVEDGTVRRVAVRHRDSGQEPRVASMRERSGPDFRTVRGADNVIRTGRSELVPVVTEAWLRDATRGPEHLAAIRAAGPPTSAIVVPLISHGQAIGAMTLAVFGRHRPFDRDDLLLAEAIADRAATAIENARLYAAAIEARQLRDEMLGVVSHDLRSPLASIRLNADILAGQTTGQQIPAIRRAVGRASRLIDDLLMTAQIDAGKLTVQPKPENVGALVRDAVELHRPLADARSIRLRTTVEEGLPEVSLDRSRIEQALGNLLTNAIKFTPESGAVELTAKRVDGALRLTVSDNGEGIPPDEMKHLFDRFWQGAHARRAGAGLGLAIVKGIVEAHGGTVTAVSELGRGSTFTVTLPDRVKP